MFKSIFPLKLVCFLISIVVVFSNCVNEIKISPLNKGLNTSSEIKMMNGEFVKGALLSYTKDAYNVESKGKIKELLRKNIAEFRFDSIFIRVYDKNVSLYVDNPMEAGVEAFNLLYTNDIELDTLQLVSLHGPYYEVRVRDSLTGYSPLYVSEENLFHVLGISSKNNLWEHLFNSSPYSLSNQAKKDSLWRTRFKRNRYVSAWVNKIQSGLYQSSDLKKKLIDVFQGTELKILDSTENNYFVFYMNWDDFFDNRQGWISKESLSFHEIKKISKEEARDRILYKKRKEFAEKHDLEGRVKEAFLKGRVREGMSQKMVKLIWGKPDKEKYYGKKYFIPYEWKYSKNNILYILSFDENRVLQAITKRP